PMVRKLVVCTRFGRGAVRLGLGAFTREVVVRPDRPRRCTLPITALRVTPPRRPAIWLALSPSVQSFFRSSTRSSVQDMGFGLLNSLLFCLGVTRNPRATAAAARS